MDGFQLQAAAADQLDPAQQALINAINNNAPDVVRPAVTAAYHVQGDQRDPKYENLQAIVDAGFKPIAALDWIWMSVNNNTDPKNRIYQFFRSTDGAAIIDYWLARSEDRTPAAQQLPLSEVHYQIRTQPMTPQSLRLVMQWEINNVATCRTAQLAFQMLNPGNVNARLFSVSANAQAGTPQAQCFDALMRTQNVRPTNWMLADHHLAFGNKRVQRVVVQPLDEADPSAPGGNPWYRCNIYLDIA